MRRDVICPECSEWSESRKQLDTGYSILPRRETGEVIAQQADLEFSETCFELHLILSIGTSYVGGFYTKLFPVRLDTDELFEQEGLYCTNNTCLGSSIHHLRKNGDCV